MRKRFKQPLTVDWHCHVLPNMDDGAKQVNISLQMLQRLAEQGIELVTATPHYHAHHESIEAFLDRRAFAFAALQRATEGREDVPKLQLSAEVRIERGISCLPLEKLSTQSGVLLLELPFEKCKPWMLRELENVCYGTELTPMLAHVERYLPYLSKVDFAELFSLDGLIFQINADALQRGKSKRLVAKLRKKGVPIAVGSDAHNMDCRPPELHAMQSYVMRHQVPLFSR